MRILVVGATGLVGQGVLAAVLGDAGITRAGALGRRDTGRVDPRLEHITTPDFSQLEAIEPRLQGWDACLYCAGAPPVGTPEAEYRHVTLELTTHVAHRFARLNPHARFLYISGMASNPASRIMPLRIKGETEQALATLPIRSVMLRTGGIRPVLGERSPHAPLRLLHAVSGPFMGLGMKFLPGMLTDTAHLARAMLVLARDPQPPGIVENREINQLGRGN